MNVVTPDAGFVPYIERELADRWALASREQRARGRRWYPTARELMEELAAETGYTVEQAVAVMAITSQGAQLVSNLRWTREALESHGAARVGRFPNQQGPKIAAVLADPAEAEAFVTGPKVGAFHRAILGDDALVLDRWAFYAAGWVTEGRDETPSDRVRAAVTEAYRRAAKRARITVRDFQAVVWLQSRESTPVLRRGRWVTPRLADITAA